jgi:hypothetical protein
MPLRQTISLDAVQGKRFELFHPASGNYGFWGLGKTSQNPEPKI